MTLWLYCVAAGLVVWGECIVWAIWANVQVWGFYIIYKTAISVKISVPLDWMMMIKISKDSRWDSDMHGAYGNTKTYFVISVCSHVI